MPTALRMLVFGLVFLVFAPILTLWMAFYTLFLFAFNRRAGLSGTAYEPFMGRLLMHEAGQRKDEAACRLADGLPALPPPMWAFMAFPTKLAVLLSGYVPSLMAYPGPRPSTLMAAMGHRTEFFDRTLEDSLDRIGQVVILGAGWDTRAYGALRDWGHPAFEVDQGPTQRAKLAGLDRAGIDRSHVTFVAVDFNRQSWLEALEEQGFDPTVPTHVIWEGVTMYLEEQAIVDTLRCVAGFPAGSSLAFDYFARQLVKAEPPYRLFGKLATLSISMFYGELVVFGYDMEPPAKEKMAAWMTENGLRLSEYECLSGEEGGGGSMYGFVLASPIARSTADRSTPEG